MSELLSLCCIGLLTKNHAKTGHRLLQSGAACIGARSILLSDRKIFGSGMARLPSQMVCSTNYGKLSLQNRETCVPVHLTSIQQSIMPRGFKCCGRELNVAVHFYRKGKRLHDLPALPIIGLNTVSPSPHLPVIEHRITSCRSWTEVPKTSNRTFNIHQLHEVCGAMGKLGIDKEAVHAAQRSKRVVITKCSLFIDCTISM